MRLTPKLRKELRDQSAHAIAALVILAPIALVPSPVAGFFSGIGLGLVRELTEEGEISLAALKSAFGSELDLAFWAVGGTIIGALAVAFA